MTNDAKPAADPTAAPKRSLLAFVRNRIIEGLILILPFVITYWIIAWLYKTCRDLFLKKLIDQVLQFIYGPRVEPPEWFEEVIAAVIAMILVLVGLYVLGMFLHSWLHRSVDSLISRVPLVTTVYTSVRKIFGTLQSQREQATKFQRVVLVPFPHPGMKVPAFVTSSCRDAQTGQTILCVYVPTTPVPTSGYMLMLPESEVTELSWSLDDTLQAIMSGGISVPPEVEYFPQPQIGEA